MSSIDPLAGLRTLASWPKPSTTAPPPVSQSHSFPATVVQWKEGVLTISTNSTISAYLQAANPTAYKPGSIVEATA